MEGAMQQAPQPGRQSIKLPLSEKTRAIIIRQKRAHQMAIARGTAWKYASASIFRAPPHHAYLVANRRPALLLQPIHDLRLVRPSEKPER